MNRRLIVTFFMLTVLLVLSCGTYAHATPSQDKVILSCDKLGFFNNSDTNISLQTDKEQIKEGEAAWVCKRVSDFIFETKIVPVDISEYEQGGIRLWFYAEDVNAFLNREVELWLTSSGSNEQDGYCWNLGSQLRTSGWQDIYLPFKEAARYGEPDLSAVNYLLLYSGGFNTTVMVDDIRASMRGADYMSAKNPFGAQNGCGVVIVNTKYSTTDVVVADIIATDAAYGADSSGREDSTLAIQSALDACSALGGGTVWLPEGSYLVTDTIVVPPYCALRGDWQDPDAAPQGETLGYGTVILARPHTLETPDAACSQGLFEICGAAGVMGLTVYYPDQSLDAPKAYPYAFYSSNGVNVGRYDPWSTDLMPSVQNCTVINGWMGIGTAVTGNNPQEYIIIENVNGTFLSTAVNMRKSMDVSSLKNVTVSNSYWAEAKESFNPPDRAALDGYTRKNAVGIMLREMEATELVNVSISDRSVGVYLADSAGTGNSARIFDLRITSCDTGIKADNIDLNWNVVITKGDIEGSLFAIENKTGGIIKLSSVTLTGDCYCEPTGDIVTQGADLDGVVPDYQACPEKPKQILYEACLDVGYGSDQSRRLQSVLDEAGRTGGVVYVRAGIYRLDNPVRVPAGVELRGASSVPVRNMDTLSYGTALYSYYGLDCDNPDRQPALITLEGENAGVRGMRIVCPQGRRPDYGDTALRRVPGRITIESSSIRSSFRTASG